MAAPRATPSSRGTSARSGKGARSVKVVVTGPFGAGKTTLIKTMSEIAVLSTERKVTDGTTALKSQTTVAMDFGRLTIDRDLVLYLFGTPGQQRFDFMWEILAEGMLGFVILLDAERDGSHAEAADILTFFRDIAAVPYVVAVNKVAHPSADAAVTAARVALDVPDGVRVVACDARDKDSVKAVLLALLHTVLDDIETSARPQPATV